MANHRHTTILFLFILLIGHSAAFFQLGGGDEDPDVTQLKSQIEDLSRVVEEQTQRITSLELSRGDTDALTQRITTLEEKQEENTNSLTERLTTVENDVATITERVATLESDVNTVTGRVVTLEGGFTTMDGRVTAVEDDVTLLKTGNI